MIILSFISMKPHLRHLGPSIKYAPKGREEGGQVSHTFSSCITCNNNNTNKKGGGEGGEEVQTECNIAYILNGRPL